MTSTSKTQADKDQHKRDRFKALKMPRVHALVQKHKQLANLANRSNYVYTENEAKAIVRFMQDQLDEAADEFLDTLKPYAEPIQFDTTEYD